MKLLEVSRYKKTMAGNISPFVLEQGEAIRAAGCEVEYFLIKGNYLKAVGALKRKIREYKPDVVHAHFGLSAITAELQGLVPVVTTFHNGETLNWHVNLMSSLMSLRAKHVIYVAQHIRDLSYFKAKRYSIIPCGVNMEECEVMDKAEARHRLGWDAKKKYILFGGAFDNLRKNYALLRDAVEILEENIENKDENTENKLTKNDESELASSSSNNLDPKSAQKQAFGQPSAQSCSVLLADSSEKKSDLQSLQKNPKNNIEIIEMKGLSRAECVLRMNACDLFALPSHSEGSPQALKEAMACNCPCLATDIADVKYLFGDESGHWILRNPRKTHERWDGDEKSLEEMVELLKEALAFEGRTNGRKRILELELSNEQVAKRIITIYNNILNNK